jgi:hypothetical protein
MARVEEQITQYLYQGESIREAFDVGPVRVVLTSHRVFASDPDDEGIKQAELPNVTGVSRTTRGSLSGVIWGVSLAIIAVAFVAVGLSVRVSDAFTAPEFQEDAASSAGAGGLTDLVGGVLWLVENLDLILLGAGAVFLLLAAVPVANYWFRVREQTLAIELAGEQPDIHLPLEYIAVEDEFRLEKALVPEQVSDDLDIDIDDSGVDTPGETPGDTNNENGWTVDNAGTQDTDIDSEGFEWISTDGEESVDGPTTDGND